MKLNDESTSQPVKKSNRGRKQRTKAIEQFESRFDLRDGLSIIVRPAQEGVFTSLVATIFIKFCCMLKRSERVGLRCEAEVINEQLKDLVEDVKRELKRLGFKDNVVVSEPFEHVNIAKVSIIRLDAVILCKFKPETLYETKMSFVQALVSGCSQTIEAINGSGYWHTCDTSEK